MDKEIKYRHEPDSPIGNDFGKIWHGCTNEECVARQNHFYHYHTMNDELHLWVDRVRISDAEKIDFKHTVIVLHSDYTLEELEQFVTKNFYNSITDESWYTKDNSDG